MRAHRFLLLLFLFSSIEGITGSSAFAQPTARTCEDLITHEMRAVGLRGSFDHPKGGKRKLTQSTADYRVQYEKRLAESMAKIEADIRDHYARTHPRIGVWVTGIPASAKAKAENEIQDSIANARESLRARHLEPSDLDREFNFDGLQREEVVSGHLDFDSAYALTDAASAAKTTAYFRGGTLVAIESKGKERTALPTFVEVKGCKVASIRTAPVASPPSIENTPKAAEGTDAQTLSGLPVLKGSSSYRPVDFTKIRILENYRVTAAFCHETRRENSLYAAAKGFAEQPERFIDFCARFRGVFSEESKECRCADGRRIMSFEKKSCDGLDYPRPPTPASRFRDAMKKTGSKVTIGDYLTAREACADRLDFMGEPLKEKDDGRDSGKSEPSTIEAV